MNYRRAKTFLPYMILSGTLIMQTAVALVLTDSPPSIDTRRQGRSEERLSNRRLEAESGLVSKQEGVRVDYDPITLSPVWIGRMGLLSHPIADEIARGGDRSLDYIDHTQADYCNSAAPHNPWILAHDFGCDPVLANQRHKIGEVWCVTLWEARRNLILHHGFGGNQIMLRLVTDGMMLCPPNPNFVQARDAFFQAVLLSEYCAEDWDRLWDAFEKRGMGRTASSPESNETQGLVESFVPAVASPCMD